jgi:hypothetical protein
MTNNINTQGFDRWPLENTSRHHFREFDFFDHSVSLRERIYVHIFGYVYVYVHCEP